MKTVFLITLVLSFSFPINLFSQYDDEFDDVKTKIYEHLYPEKQYLNQHQLSIKHRGIALANNLYNSLESMGSLSASTDPQKLLDEFNMKMKNIQQLEAQFNKESLTYGFNTGTSIINNLQSGNRDFALAEAAGYLESLSAQSQARRELKEREQALLRERQQRMSEIYWKAQDFNTQTRLEYIKAAAYAESIIDEKYNLDFAENLACFSKSMKLKYHSSSTNWLVNSCPKPQKNNFATIENKFVARDIQYSNIARHKYEYYETSRFKYFREAAISFAAAAAKTNPSAKHFALLGDYYYSHSTVLSLTNYIVAHSYDKNYLNSDQKNRVEHLKHEAEQEISEAIIKNEQNYLNAFMDAGLDQVVSLEGKSLLNYVIKLDQPDALQIILNKYIDGKPQDEVTATVQKAVLLCAINNSTSCIERFLKLGVNMDFTQNNYSPVEVAAKAYSVEVYNKLVNISGKKQYFDNKYKNSSFSLYQLAIENPELGAQKIDNNSRIKVEQLTRTLLEREEIPEVLFKSRRMQYIIHSNATLRKKIYNLFALEIEKPAFESKAADFLESGLIRINSIPLFGDITDVKNIFKEALESKIVKVESIKKSVPKMERVLDKLLDSLFSIKYNPDLWTKKVYNSLDIYPDESIAYMAFIRDNLELFKWLDAHYDLSKVTNKNGVGLYESMLRSKKSLININKKDYIKEQKTVYESSLPIKNTINKRYGTFDAWIDNSYDKFTVFHSHDFVNYDLNSKKYISLIFDKYSKDPQSLIQLFELYNIQLSSIDEAGAAEILKKTVDMMLKYQNYAKYVKAEYDVTSLSENSEFLTKYNISGFKYWRRGLKKTGKFKVYDLPGLELLISLRDSGINVNAQDNAGVTGLQYFRDNIDVFQRICADTDTKKFNANHDYDHITPEVNTTLIIEGLLNQSL